MGGILNPQYTRATGREAAPHRFFSPYDLTIPPGTFVRSPNLTISPGTFVRSKPDNFPRHLCQERESLRASQPLGRPASRQRTMPTWRRQKYRANRPTRTTSTTMMPIMMGCIP